MHRHGGIKVSIKVSNGCYIVDEGALKFFNAASEFLSLEGALMMTYSQHLVEYPGPEMAIMPPSEGILRNGKQEHYPINRNICLRIPLQMNLVVIAVHILSHSMLASSIEIQVCTCEHCAQEVSSNINK